MTEEQFVALVQEVNDITTRLEEIRRELVNARIAVMERLEFAL